MYSEKMCKMIITPIGLVTPDQMTVGRYYPTWALLTYIVGRFNTIEQNSTQLIFI